MWQWTGPWVLVRWTERRAITLLNIQQLADVHPQRWVVSIFHMNIHTWCVRLQYLSFAFNHTHILLPCTVYFTRWPLTSCFVNDSSTVSHDRIWACSVLVTFDSSADFRETVGTKTVFVSGHLISSTEVFEILSRPFGCLDLFMKPPLLNMISVYYKLWLPRLWVSLTQHYLLLSSDLSAETDRFCALTVLYYCTTLLNCTSFWDSSYICSLPPNHARQITSQFT